MDEQFCWWLMICSFLIYWNPKSFSFHLIFLVARVRVLVVAVIVQVEVQIWWRCVAVFLILIFWWWVVTEPYLLLFRLQHRLVLLHCCDTHPRTILRSEEGAGAHLVPMLAGLGAADVAAGVGWIVIWISSAQPQRFVGCLIANWIQVRRALGALGETAWQHLAAVFFCQ